MEAIKNEVLRVDDLSIASYDRDRLILGVLAGFAFSASVTFATKIDDKRKRVSVILELMLAATCFLIVATCQAWYLADVGALLKSKGVARFPEEVWFSVVLFNIAGLLGLGAITLAIALLGFVRSWLLGISTFITAAIAVLFTYLTTANLGQVMVRLLTQ